MIYNARRSGSVEKLLALRVNCARSQYYPAARDFSQIVAGHEIRCDEREMVVATVYEY